MLLGIPRGFFYYDYIEFIRILFTGADLKLIVGKENEEGILLEGNKITVDEVCLPIKLFAGQVQTLCRETDKVLVPRIMKDCKGRWVCPKLLGLPELLSGILDKEKLLITEPIYMNEEAKAQKSLWHMCRKLGMERNRFRENFLMAYDNQRNIANGLQNIHVEAEWEFIPPLPREGEIILPNIRTVLVTGHCYNVYDKFANGNIMKKLDELGIGAMTEKHTTQKEQENAVSALCLIKKPFWEAMVRVLGTALHLRKQVEGIVYLSSFSCGLDAFIIEMIKKYIPDLPILVLKLDAQKGAAGVETRIEAFADLLEKRRAAWS